MVCRMVKMLGVGLAVCVGVSMMSWGQDAAGKSEPKKESGAKKVEMSDIVVTASRRERPLRDTADVVQVIDRRTIDEIRPLSTGELMEYATGVAVSTGTGSGLPDRSVVSVNGLPPQYTLVLVDGVRLLTDHQHTGQNLEFIPPEAIERIEVMRGASSAQYGTDAIGGIVNIVTRRCTGQPEASVSAAAGSYNSLEGGLTLLAPVADAVRLSSFAHWEQSDGTPLLAPAHRIDKTGYSRLNLLNRVDVDLGKDTDSFLSLNYVGYTMDWRESTADSYLVTPVVGLSHALNASVDVAGQVAYSLWDSEVNAENNTFWEPSAHVTWQVDDSQALMAGGDYRWNEFERSAVVTHDQDAMGAFLQHEWKATRNFSTMAALRYDKVEDVEVAWSPKLSAMYTPVDAVRVRASVGRGFHAPSLQELHEEGYGHGGRAYRFGNPDLDPEYSTTYTVGLEVQPAEPVQVLLHGFYSDIDDMIVPVYQGPWAVDPTKDVWRRTNIQNAEVYGGEASVRVKPVSGVSVEGGYTYTENEDKDTGRQLPYRPGSSVYGRVAVTQPLAGTTTLGGFVGVRAGFDREAWNWQPAAGATVDNPDGLTTPLKDYTKLDAGLTLCVGEDYEFFVKVENILGEDIENLDDSYTIIDGEPVYQFGVKYNLPLAGK